MHNIIFQENYLLSFSYLFSALRFSRLTNKDKPIYLSNGASHMLDLALRIDILYTVGEPYNFQ